MQSGERKDVLGKRGMMIPKGRREGRTIIKRKFLEKKVKYTRKSD